MPGYKQSIRFFKLLSDVVLTSEGFWLCVAHAEISRVRTNSIKYFITALVQTYDSIFSVLSHVIKITKADACGKAS